MLLRHRQKARNCKTGIDGFDADAIAGKAGIDEQGLEPLMIEQPMRVGGGERPATHDRTMRRVDHHAATGSEHAPRLTEGSRIRHEVHHVHRQDRIGDGVDERKFGEVPADQFETAGRKRKPVAARGLGEHHIRPVEPDDLRSARDVKQRLQGMARAATQLEQGLAVSWA